MEEFVQDGGIPGLEAGIRAESGFGDGAGGPVISAEGRGAGPGGSGGVELEDGVDEDEGVEEAGVEECEMCSGKE